MVGIKYFIGLDIGGTNTRGILWNGKKIIKNREIKTPQTKGGFEKCLKKLIAGLSRGRKIAGIGIGSAGVVNGTTLISSRNIPAVKNFDFGQTCRIPGIRHVKVDNDARTFARGEYVLGTGRGFKSVFFLTIGTGIGRAFGKNGKILKIKKFEYSERWEREYQCVRDKKDDKKLAEFLGRYLTKLIKPYKPQAIIIGGGVALDRKNFVQKLRIEFQKHDLKSKVLKARLGPHSATLGATLIFKP